MVKPSWASLDPETLSAANPATMYNLLNGEWVLPKSTLDIIDPMNGETFIKMANTQPDELEPFVVSANKCPKSGLHNIYKNVERYIMYGKVSAKLGEELRKPEIADFFARLIQRVCPKSYTQAMGEVNVSRTMIENFSGDQVRFLARGFSNPGDRYGQKTNGYRWPFGPVVIVSPFNFPLEIPILQLMGALYMGNHVTIKAASTTTAVVHEFLRLMHFCGAPKTDVNFLCCGGRVMEDYVRRAKPRCLQFTGGCSAAEKLAEITGGKVRVEDAGFDWKILGPDADAKYLDYVAWQADQDAYALSGQKCSAQSILFAHTNWVKLGLLPAIEKIAMERKIDDLSIGPVLSHTTEEMIAHAKRLASIPGARILFGAKELPKHTIPKKYGAIYPTAVFVPLKEIMKDEHFAVCTTEIFGPFQVITEYENIDDVLACCERIPQHLTAAIVSNDQYFLHKTLGNTVNGTTYAGMRARTTGAPQNHWFGPAGDPRGAGIGTPEAIRLVWSCHREIIEDYLAPENFKRPPPN